MLKKLKIAMIGSNYLRIPPRNSDLKPGQSGAAESVIYDLTESLVRKGHNVTLFASKDSKTSARLCWHTAKSLTAGNHIGSGKHLPLELAHLSFAARMIRKGNFDIVHSHLDWMFSYFTPFINIPIVITLHSPFTDYPKPFRKMLLKTFPCPWYVSISDRQRKHLPGLRYAKTIYHGINIKKFKFNPFPDDHFLFAGRMVEKKGPHLAIAATLRSQNRLYLAGDYYRDNNENRQYFRTKIKPHLDGKRITWSGKWLSKKELAAQYGKSRALLSPIGWEEPFGLVHIEAMACGTPVIAFNRGSAKEVVKNGVTGFVVDNVIEMAAAMEEIDTISRAACRKWTQENFSSERMAIEYEKLYYEILK